LRGCMYLQLFSGLNAYDEVLLQAFGRVHHGQAGHHCGQPLDDGVPLSHGKQDGRGAPRRDRCSSDDGFQVCGPVQ